MPRLTLTELVLRLTAKDATDIGEANAEAGSIADAGRFKLFGLDAAPMIGVTKPAAGACAARFVELGTDAGSLGVCLMVQKNTRIF